jgi:hypothetical protein
VQNALLTWKLVTYAESRPNNRTPVNYRLVNLQAHHPQVF